MDISCLLANMCCCNGRHQRLNEILTILSPQRNIREISKFVYKKTLSCNTPAKLDAILCDQHALVINALAGFIQQTPDRVFFFFFQTTLLISRMWGLKVKDFSQSLTAFEIATSPSATVDLGQDIEVAPEIIKKSYIFISYFSLLWY